MVFFFIKRDSRCGKPGSEIFNDRNFDYSREKGKAKKKRLIPSLYVSLNYDILLFYKN